MMANTFSSEDFCRLFGIHLQERKRNEDMDEDVNTNVDVGVAVGVAVDDQTVSGGAQQNASERRLAMFMATNAQPCTR